MTLILAGRSIVDAVAEVQRRPHWGIFGLRRNRSDAFEPWGSDEPFCQFVMQRVEQVWVELEEKPSRARLPALVLFVGSDRSDLDRPTIYTSLRDIVDKLLHSDFHWQPGNDARAILDGCFLRDAESLDKALAEIATLRTTTPTVIRESIPLSADALKETFSRHQSQLHQLQADIAARIEGLLAPYAGMQPATIDEGQCVCRTINDLVAAFGLRLQTAEMEDPATLAYYRIGRTKAGAFVFTGMKEGKRQVTYGATALPALKVVPAPPHGRRKAKPRKKKR